MRLFMESGLNMVQSRVRFIPELSFLKFFFFLIFGTSAGSG